MRFDDKKSLLAELNLHYIYVVYLIFRITISVSKDNFHSTWHHLTRSMLNYKKRNKYEANRFKAQCRKQQQRESKLYLQSDIKISYVVK